MEKVNKTKEETTANEIKLKGKYVQAVGRRKAAHAQVRLYKNGTGIFAVNGVDVETYFTPDLLNSLKQPLKIAGEAKDLNVSAVVAGGGKKGQSEAVRHGISMAMLQVDAELRPALKAKGFLTRDAREKERKKPGLKKARKSPQWAKR